MNLWWVPFSVAALLLLLVVVAHIAGADSFRRRIVAYRRSYLLLVARFERQTILLNRLAPALAELRQETPLSAYEDCLQLFENLLVLVTSISPFGQNKMVLDSAHFLQKDFDMRLRELQASIALAAQGKLMASENNAGVKTKTFPLGCYFCSRPFIYSGLSKVKARIEGRLQQVHSCVFCKEELLKTRKVRILYFMKDDKPVHWTQVKEYNPVHDFWELHRKNITKKPTKLELIVSKDRDDPMT